MKLDEMRKIHDYKIETLKQFKAEVTEAIESTCHWKETDGWLHEQYDDCSNSRDKMFRAQVMVLDDCYNDKTPTFRRGYRDISSVTVYDIFYLYSSGGFVINDVTIRHDAIKAIMGMEGARKV